MTPRAVSPQEERVVADAIAWAHLHGLVVGHGDGIKDHSIIHAPFALHPTPFPTSEFQLVQRSMPVFARLVHAVSQDSEYLQRTLAPAAKFDDFTRGLLDTWAAAQEQRQRYGSSVTLGLHRSDFMLDEPSTSLLQVELNTIASSFGSLSTQVSALHRYLLTLHADWAHAALPQLPEQNALRGFAAAMARAHELNCATQQLGSRAVVVMVVQPGERNSFDQHWLAVTLWEQHGVRVVRRTLRDIHDRGSVDDSGGFSIDELQVSLFYLRAGYSPDDYQGEEEWQARKLMESCSAVSCPSVAYQLVGAKKIQQDLAGPGQLERFISDESERETLRACFAGMWGLEDLSDSDTAAAVQAAVAEPYRYILKPQREGGGNNLYGDDLKQQLQRGGEALASYILMQRIRPPVHQSVLVRRGEAVTEECVTELGVYGAFVQHGRDVVVNECCGHLLRTKAVTSDEGGVAAGFAVIDSPYLTD